MPDSGGDGERNDGKVDAEFETLGAFISTLSESQREAFHSAQRVWPVDDVTSCLPAGSGSVWIGPHLATWPTSLNRCGITHILCLTQEPPAKQHVWARNPTIVCHMPLDDEPGEDLLSRLDDAVAWIYDAVVAGGHVLCHCRAGRSRSAAVVAAFFLRAEGCSPEAAVECIRAARPFVSINSGFLEQLQEFSRAMGDGYASAKCELCRLERVAPWLEESAVYAVLFCDQCDNPMVVWRRHTMLLAAEEHRSMKMALTRHADKHFGNGNWYLDNKQRTIVDHVHWHARPHTELTRLYARFREEKRLTGEPALGNGDSRL